MQKTILQLEFSDKASTDAAGTESDSEVYVIGHSSGAVCIMRLLETYRVDGAFLVSGCVSDLGEASERISGFE